MPRLTYARVMVAATGLVLLLGGGYAVALKGTGTLQKENEIGFTGAPEVIRTIKGVGEIRAIGCFVDPPTRTMLEFRNTSGESLRLFIDVAAAPDPAPPPTVANGDTLHFTTLSGGNSVIRLHVLPTDGSKDPQARVMLSHRASATTCNDVQVAVLNWSTRE